jgi:hypothetical protein
MALQSSGQISLNDLHVEVGGTSGTECSMNDSDIRGLIGLSSANQAAMNAFYGASSGQFFIPKNNGSGSYSQLTRVSGSTIYIEAGYIGPNSIYQHTGYNPPLMAANQGSLSPTSFPGGHTIVGIIGYGNPGGTQIQIYVSGGGTINMGFTTLTISAYGTAYGTGPSGTGSPYTQTRTWTATMNRTSASYYTSSSGSSGWDRSWRWTSYGGFSGDNPLTLFTASLSSTHTGNGISLVFT